MVLGTIPRFSRIISLLFSACIFYGLPVCTQAAIVYKVIDLGALEGGYSEAHSINEAGQIVGAASSSEQILHATIFDSTGAVNNIDMGTLGGNESMALAINDAGQIIGWSQNAQGRQHATLFDPTSDGNNVDLGTLEGLRSMALAINNSGQIVGLADDKQGLMRASLFDSTGDGNNINLGILAGNESIAFAINDTGQIIGCSQNAQRWQRATLFDPTSDGNHVDLGTVGGLVSLALAINNSGQIVGWADDKQHPINATLFDSTGDGYNINLSPYDSFITKASAINDAGQIVGSSQIDFTSSFHATLFDPTGDGNNIDLNTLIDPNSGWTLTHATDINNNGWIVGNGINPQNEQHAFLLVPISTKYSGGTGEPNDPYQIATFEDLMLLGESPEDYDKHFILTTDIDLDPNLPGRKVFDKAVIGFDWKIPFTGFFDGNGHTISNLTIVGESHLGLFMRLDDEAMVSNLGLEAVNINGTSNYVGGLAGHNTTEAAVVLCYSTGMVKGNFGVGGLVGINAARCSITASYSTITVDANECVGGLVGQSYGSIAASYGSGTVTGNTSVGGLVGIHSYGGIDACFSTATVSGTSNVGGLVGSKTNGITTTSFWDVETSGQTTSAGGIGLITTEMQDIGTYLNAGWDFVDEFLNGTCDYWQISTGDYPHLRYHAGDSPVMPEGLGTAEQPYLIQDARDLGTVWYEPMAYYRMGASVDMSQITWSMAIAPWFGGNFDGNGYVISNLHIQGCGKMGMFSQLVSGAMISNLGLEAVDVNGLCDYVGGLVGFNSGQITTSYINGSVMGNNDVGGIAGENHGDITKCYSNGVVYGDDYIGGLVGDNRNQGSVAQCYSNSSVNGDMFVGGLLGHNGDSTVDLCYSAGKVNGNKYVGGLVGDNYFIGNILHCVWDVETSGLSENAGGIGLTTEEMMDPNVLGLNGFANDPNWVLDVGKDYPSLAWEGHAGQIIHEPDIDFMTGEGTQENPYRINTSDQLILLGRASALWDKHFVMGADINLDPNLPKRKIFSHALIQVFSGVFDGNNHTISCMSIKGRNFLGLFGKLLPEAMVKNLGVVDVSITSSDGYICGSVAYNLGAITNCYSTGTVSSTQCVGGLIGLNEGAVTNCYSNSTVSGDYWVGGLVGYNNYQGVVEQCYSTGQVSGDSAIGGLVGGNDYRGIVNQCYSTVVVSGNSFVGGLVGDNSGDVNQCYSTGAVSGSLWCVGGLIGGIGARATACFWDIETSGQLISEGGTGKTTTEMQMAGTFLEAGWDFVDETANGTEDIWWILEGQNYPRLWWEGDNN
jgi:probable HAF family extracellular repeat protein